MSLPTPFAYPDETHRRKHGPLGYEPYDKYRDRLKTWLRDEFQFRCVYCLEREAWYPNRQAAFTIDHVEARSVNPDRICDYDNMVYACGRCNSSKREIPTLDPTDTPFAEHLRVSSDGTIEGLTPEGQELILLLGLNDRPAVENRLDAMDILELKREYPDDPRVQQMLLRKFRFPQILPNLRKYSPPGGNSRPDGVKGCYYQLRRAGRLPEHY